MVAGTSGMVRAEKTDVPHVARIVIDRPDRANAFTASMCAELRAALCLARLYVDRGQPVLARNMVLPIYERFEEGFDTLDLREARDLLHLFADR